MLCHSQHMQGNDPNYRSNWWFPPGVPFVATPLLQLRVVAAMWPGLFGTGPAQDHPVVCQHTMINRQLIFGVPM